MSLDSSVSLFALVRMPVAGIGNTVLSGIVARAWSGTGNDDAPEPPCA